MEPPTLSFAVLNGTVLVDEARPLSFSATKQFLSDLSKQSGEFHSLRILFTGGDPSLASPDGRAVNEEVYEDKGKLVFDKRYRQADLPGLWVAGQYKQPERWMEISH